MSGNFELMKNRISNTRGFKIALLNIVSLPKYIDEIRMSESFKSFDIIAFNGTRLDSSISDGEVKICGYDLIRKDRSRKGGSVCICEVQSLTKIVVT